VATAGHSGGGASVTFVLVELRETDHDDLTVIVVALGADHARRESEALLR
jgi:hypothetical protein